jgi:hypothetical protein
MLNFVSYLVVGTSLVAFAGYRPNRVRRLSILLIFLVALDIYDTLVEEDQQNCEERKEENSETDES